MRQAGLTPSWWAVAIMYFCIACNVMVNGEPTATPYYARHGVEFPAVFSPMGNEVDFLPTPEPGAQFEKGDKTATGLFLGWYMKPGGQFGGSYYVAATTEFQDAMDKTPCKCRIQRVESVLLR